MAEDLRVGIIGCGALGRTHAQRFSAIPGVRVEALTDTVIAAAESVKVELDPAVMIYPDYQSLLNHDLDIVCIASPDSYHVEQVLAALDAGCHVLCEKPLTLDASELEAVVLKQQATGLHVSMTYPRRYDRAIHQLRSDFLAGEFGQLKAVFVSNVEDWVTPNVSTWRHDPSICPGGFFYDANGHQLDFLFWVTGRRAVCTQARVDRSGTPVPIRVWGEAELEGDIPCVFNFVGHAHSWREQIDLYCENGEALLMNGRPFISRGGELTPVEVEGDEDNSAAAFVRLVREGGENFAPPSDFRDLVQFTVATLQSAEADGIRISI
jgi:predicted dehydrogenase